MGQIRIDVTGSFDPNRKNVTFSAENGGHADCVALAIEWLAQIVLPAAIEQDHALHSIGEKPVNGWGHKSGMDAKLSSPTAVTTNPNIPYVPNT